MVDRKHVFELDQTEECDMPRRNAMPHRSTLIAYFVVAEACMLDTRVHTWPRRRVCARRGWVCPRAYSRGPRSPPAARRVGAVRGRADARGARCVVPPQACPGGMGAVARRVRTTQWSVVREVSNERIYVRRFGFIPSSYVLIGYTSQKPRAQNTHPNSAPSTRKFTHE